jgi:hypothetical protein
MATEKQLAFAEKLAKEKGTQLPAGYLNFTTAAMSKVINELLSLKNAVASVTTSVKTVTKVFVTAGFYCLDGEIVKVQLNQAGTKHYAKRLIQEGETWHFYYEAGLINKLTPAMKLEEEQAAAFGKIYGYCCICSARLTNETSIERGIGPICADNQGW